MAGALGTVEVALLCEEGNLGQQVGWLLRLCCKCKAMHVGSLGRELGVVSCVRRR